MKVLGIVLLVLAALALLPLGVRARYDRDGVFLQARLWLFRVRLLPAKAKGEKKAKRRKARAKPKPPKPEAEERPPDKKGGALDPVRAALPLIRPALSGLRRRLTIRDLELHVTWSAADPADAAIGYGRAQAALGALQAVVEEGFRVRRSRLGCSVDFEQTSPTVYADATLTIRLGQVVTLVLPLLIRFLANFSRIRRERTKNNRKEA